MENKEIITPLRGEQTLNTFFLWLQRTVIRVLNKQWVVELPPNTGVATVRDSFNKVTIDLSKVKFTAGAASIVVGSTYIDVTPVTVGGVTTYTVALDIDAFTMVDTCDPAIKVLGIIV